MTIDTDTKDWIRNASDMRAAENGCRFDGERGQFVVDWFSKYLRLYEGDFAGEPFKPMDCWAEMTMRLFGWVHWSDRWQREIRRFTQASLWAPKKSAKSPFLAGCGLYLLCGDGEMGQKVYFGAKDGGQAREISGKHAIEMAQASDELMSECTINRSLMQITHEPSRSLLKPISSNDAKSQKAKEGLNGCLLVDETHVVDRAFMNRVSRAGISRSEPLHIEVSTAGNDPQSYGRERYDYGKQIESGQRVDERLLFVSYEAPQDLSDADLAADPVKWGRMANPAWGRTVGEDEYLDDYNRSRVSISQLADFKMYRLNIWQASENPWLKMGDWEACQEAFSEEDLFDRDCYGGLDLAKTMDTTALVLVFPDEDGTYRQLAYFWLPEERARDLARTVSYQEWARRGDLTLTPDKTCDYGFIRKAVNEIRQKFNLRRLAFDGTYAEQLTQRLAEEDGLDINVLRKFPQTVMAFAGATAAYERAVIEGDLRHNGNQLLTWQAGNAKVRQDANGNMRPVKQQHGDHRTIDGIVAGIMAFALAIEGVREESVYETRDMLVIGGDDD